MYNKYNAHIITNNNHEASIHPSHDHIWEYVYNTIYMSPSKRSSLNAYIAIITNHPYHQQSFTQHKKWTNINVEFSPWGSTMLSSIARLLDPLQLSQTDCLTLPTLQQFIYFINGGRGGFSPWKPWILRWRRRRNGREDENECLREGKGCIYTRIELIRWWHLVGHV